MILRCKLLSIYSTRLLFFWGVNVMKYRIQFSHTIKNHSISGFRNVCVRVSVVPIVVD